MRGRTVMQVGGALTCNKEFGRGGAILTPPCVRYQEHVRVLVNVVKAGVPVRSSFARLRAPDGLQIQYFARLLDSVINAGLP
jgi:hypothetical protein